MRKIATLLVAFGLTLGLVGAGISAQFTDNASASQDIQVGSFGISLATDTAGATVSTDGTTLTCPTVAPPSSAAAYGTVGCHATIKSDGTLAPTSVRLYAQVTVTGTANPAHFIAQFNEGAGSWTPNMYGNTPSLSTFTAKTLVSTTTVVPADMYTDLGWGELDNNDLNSVVLVTYSIEAVG